METNSNRIKENHTIAADILDDLASRFIINIPDSDRSNFVRICFQIELAHWFYLDFYCTGEENRALVPCGIKQFASHIFNVCKTALFFSTKLSQMVTNHFKLIYFCYFYSTFHFCHCM